MYIVFFYLEALFDLVRWWHGV